MDRVDPIFADPLRLGHAIIGMPAVSGHNRAGNVLALNGVAPVVGHEHLGHVKMT